MTLSLSFLRRLCDRQTSKLLALGASVLTGAGAALLGSGSPAIAADSVVLTYGPIVRSIAVSDLRQLADTGEVPRSLRFYINLADVDPAAVSEILNQEVTVNLLFLDDALNTLPGEFALFQLGEVIHTPSRRANIQALRSAAILSASADNRISLIEFLENYPINNVYVDGVKVAKVARAVTNVVGDVERVVEIITPVLQEYLGGLICECETTSTLAPSSSVTSTSNSSTTETSP